MSIGRTIKDFLANYQLSWHGPAFGIIWALAFPPWHYSFLAWIGFVPLLMAFYRARTLSNILSQALWINLWVNLCIFPWVVTGLRDYVRLPWPLVIVIYVMSGMVCQIQLYPFALAVHYLKKCNSQFFVIITGSLLYTGMDWISPKAFLDTLGHCFHNFPNLRQFADIGGVYGLTLLITSHGFAFYFLLKKLWTIEIEQPNKVGIKTELLQYALFLSICLGATYYGWNQKSRIQTLMAEAHSNGNEITLGGVQANILGIEKLQAFTGYAPAFTKIIDTHLDLSERMLLDKPIPDVIVWPETTYPYYYRNSTDPTHLKSEDKMENFVEQNQVSLIFGGYHRASGDERVKNVSFHLSVERDAVFPSKGRLERYEKVILILIGEYVPYWNEFKILRKLFPTTANFENGKGPINFSLRARNGNVYKATSAICYEILFSEYLRAAALLEPDLIVNVTNDAWFGRYGEPDLHMSLAKFRTIENRLPLFRSTNTGISAWVTQDGEIHEPTGVYTQATLKGTLPILPQVPTLFKKWGGWIGPTSLKLGLSFLGIFLLSGLLRKEIQYG